MRSFDTVVTSSSPTIVSQTLDLPSGFIIVGIGNFACRLFWIPSLFLAVGRVLPKLHVK